MKTFFALNLSDAVFIMLINNCWHFNIYEQDKFRAKPSWAWKKFYYLRAWNHVTITDLFAHYTLIEIET